MSRRFLPKALSNESIEETAIRQQLSLEKLKAEINLLKIRSQNYFERFQTLDAHMITHLIMNYDNDIFNLLTKLWKTDCLKKHQESVNIFDTKSEWYLNNNTTELRNNSEERKPKQESKQNSNNNNNRRTQNSQRQNRYKDSKNRSGSRSYSQITKRLQNTMRKVIRTKNTLHQRNQEIKTVTRKISINLGNSTAVQNKNKKNNNNI